MSTSPLAILREVGTPEQMRSHAVNGHLILSNNAHLHLPPNFSAFTTVKQAMELADTQGCRIVGTSNYYDYQIYNEFAAQARRHSIFPLFGIEIICLLDDLQTAGIKINDPGNPGKMYICGKGITRFMSGSMSAEAKRILGIIRTADSARTSQMVDRMSRIFAERGFPNRVNTEMVIDMVVRRHDVPAETVFLQERHVAQALQEYFFDEVPEEERIARLTTLLGAAPRIANADDYVGVQNEIRTHLMKAGKPGYVNETFIEFPSAYQLILELAGIPCYPILGDAAKPVCPFEDDVDKLIASLRERKIHAAEFITGRNAVSFLLKYSRALRGAGILVTAGTEHNTLDLIPMGPVCLGGVPLPPELQEMYYEGACVLAAHQFLNAHGEMGYVDGAGNLNPAFSSAEERISSLARLGDAVIRKYLKTNG